MFPWKLQLSHSTDNTLNLPRLSSCLSGWTATIPSLPSILTPANAAIDHCLYSFNPTNSLLTDFSSSYRAGRAWMMASSASSVSTPAQQSPAPSTVNSRPGTPNLSTPPTTAATDKVQDDSSKLRTFLSLLRKFIGVTDIAAVRFSLPAQLLEPIPNLEYWHYLDRPETFVSIGKSDDDVGRMLEVMRFWFTKDLKYVKGKPCKPYNSALGEFFRCNWEIKDDAPTIKTPSKAPPQPPPDPLQAPASGHDASDPVRISYLTEQTSHHPPVSAYYVSCPSHGIEARGFDQISAKFTGTAVRVTPGTYNKGIFIKLSKRSNEEYQLTHPTASLGGLLRGALVVSVADICYITCAHTKIKAILHYLEEGWVGKSQNKVVGVVFRFDPSNDKYTRIKDVPEKEVLARVEGCWQEQIYYSIPSSSAVSDQPGTEPTSKKQLLIDLIPLMPVPKIVPPPTEQLPNESRRFWQDVTTAIMDKKYAEATRVKQDIEQAQRDKAAERQKDGVTWKPRYFTPAATSGGDGKGKPELNELGKKVIDGMQHLDFHLEDGEVGSSEDMK